MKKLIPMMLSLTMMVSMSNVAFAAASNGDQAKDKVHVEVETQVLHGTAKGALPARHKDIVDSLRTSKVKAASGVRTPMGLSARSAKSSSSWVKLPSYRVFNQITSYNCGPASVQAALNYLNGSTPNQSAIAQGCQTNRNGSYLANLKNYINSQQSKNPYEAMYNKNYATLTGCLYTGITEYNAPPVVGMAFSSNDGWLYSSGGHFMSVFGVKSDRSGFVLGDPWIGYSGSGLNSYSWSYSKSASDLYNAYHSVNIGFMY